MMNDGQNYGSKITDEKGVALVVVLLVLITLTIIMIGVFQNNAMDIFIARNSVLQPEALQSALACETQKLADIQSIDETIQQRDLDLNFANPMIKCQSAFDVDHPVSRERLDGWDVGSLQITIFRLTTVGEGRRGARMRLISDIPIARDLINNNS